MPGTFDELTGTAAVPGEGDDAVDQAHHSADGLTAAISVEGGRPESEQDDSRTPRQVREVAKELTRYGLIEAARKPNLYRVVQNQTQALSAILEPLDLDLAIDDVRGIAFVKVRSEDLDNGPSPDEEHDPEDWSHPLVRRQRLTLEQSLLVAILRQHFVAHEQEAGVGADDARVAVDELIPEFQIYLGDPGSEAKERTRMLTLLDQLKGHGLVSEPDTHERVTIRPIIAHLASPENLQHLLAWLRQRRTGETGESEQSREQSREPGVAAMTSAAATSSGTDPVSRRSDTRKDAVDAVANANAIAEAEAEAEAEAKAKAISPGTTTAASTDRADFERTTQVQDNTSVDASNSTDRGRSATRGAGQTAGLFDELFDELPDGAGGSDSSRS